MFVCLSITKDLASRWTIKVLLYRVAPHRFREGLLLFWGKEQPPSLEKLPLIFLTKIINAEGFSKNWPLQKQIPLRKIFLLNLKITKNWVIEFNSLFLKCP